VAGAILIAANSLVALRTAAFVRWLAASGLVVALLVLLGAFLATGAVFLVLAWIVAASVAMLGWSAMSRAPTTTSRG
jgi:hypothetical protein